MMTVEEFTDFLYGTQDLAFEEKRDKVPRTYTKYTRKISEENADHRSVTGIKLGPAAYTPLGGQSHLDEYQPGTTLIIKPKKLTISVITPHELETDMYNNGRIDEDKVKFFSKMGTDMNESHEWAWETLCTDFQLRGTSTTATSFWQGAGRDSLALFSTSHVTTKGTPVTWSNYQTSGPMTAIALMEGVTMLEDIPDETGRPQGSIKRVGIVHGRFWSWRVPELLKAVRQPDTMNYGTPNALNERYDPVEWVPILNPYLGSTEASWMLVNLDDNQLCFWLKEKPTVRRDVEARTGNKIIVYYSRVATFFESAKCALKNDGS